MAHTKSGGSTRNLRDSQPKYLGIKLFAGQIAQPGSILVRQRGTKFLPGKNVRRGKDDTLYSIVKGAVEFSFQKRKKFNGRKKTSSLVNVEPLS